MPLWERYQSDDGQNYYYNTSTEETTWDKPAEFDGEEEAAAAHDEYVASETTDHVVGSENYSHASQHDVYDYSYSADAASELAASHTGDHPGSNDAAAHATPVDTDDHHAAQEPEVSPETATTASVDAPEISEVLGSDPSAELENKGATGADTSNVNGNDESATAQLEVPEATSEDNQPVAETKGEHDHVNSEAPASPDAGPSETAEQEIETGQVDASEEPKNATVDTDAKADADRDTNAEQEAADDQTVQSAGDHVKPPDEQSTKGLNDASVTAGDQTAENNRDADSTDGQQAQKANVVEAESAQGAEEVTAHALGNEAHVDETVESSSSVEVSESAATSQSTHEKEDVGDEAVESASTNDSASAATPIQGADTAEEVHHEGADPGSKRKLGRTVSIEARARENVAKLPPKDDLLWEAVLDDKSGQYYYWNHATDEIVWDKPADYVAPRDEKAEASAMKIQALARGWSTRNGPSVGMRGLMEKPRYQSLVSTLMVAQEAALNSGTVGDWEFAYDATSKRIYFFSEASGETVWDIPAGATNRYLLQADKREMTAAVAIQSVVRRLLSIRRVAQVKKQLEEAKQAAAKLADEEMQMQKELAQLQKQVEGDAVKHAARAQQRRGAREEELERLKKEAEEAARVRKEAQLRKERRKERDAKIAAAKAKKDALLAKLQEELQQKAKAHEELEAKRREQEQEARHQREALRAARTQEQEEEKRLQISQWFLQYKNALNQANERKEQRRERAAKRQQRRQQKRDAIADARLQRKQYMESSYETLFEAVRMGCTTRCFQRLIGAAQSRNPNYDVNEHCHASGETLLHMAAWHGHVHLVRELLSFGANVNEIDSACSLTTPLHEATRAGNGMVVQLLLAAKADVFAQDSHGDTALHCACRSNRTIIVRLLLLADPRLETPTMLNHKKKAPVELCTKFQLLELFASFEDERFHPQARAKPGATTRKKRSQSKPASLQKKASAGHSTVKKTKSQRSLDDTRRKKKFPKGSTYKPSHWTEMV